MADSAGITIVDNRRIEWDGPPWALDAAPLTAIGVLDGNPEYQLFGIRAAARQSDGTIVVIDESRSVRRFDATGAFLGSSGRIGSGPGEFVEPTQILIDDDDAISVWDERAYRITRLDRSGDLIEMTGLAVTDLMSVIEPPHYPGPGLLVGDGRVAIRFVTKGPVGGKGAGGTAAVTAGSPSDQTYRPATGAVIVSTDLTAVDTLPLFADDEMALLPPDAGSIPIPPAGAKTTSIVVQPGGGSICVAERQTSEVSCFEPDGGRRLVRWPHDPVSLTPDDVTAWRDATIESWGPKMSRAEATSLLSEVAAPPTRPAYGAVLLDRVGNLWVQRDGNRLGASTQYIVFDPTGALLGPVTLPEIRILEIGEDYVLGVHLDDLDVEYLHLYRLEKPAG